MTSDDRWLVARYCGWNARKCDEAGCCCDQFWLYCGQMVVNEDAWWDDMPSADDLARHLPSFDTDPAQVVTMLEAMAKEDRIPRLKDCGKAWGAEIYMPTETCSEYVMLFKGGRTISEAVFAACLACAKDKFNEEAP